MTPPLSDRLQVLVVLERRLAEPRSLLDIVEAALAGGAGTLQLRNKGDSARELAEAGRLVLARTRAHGALLIINDRVDVALALGADGVHVGPDDLPVSAVRSCTPRDFLIGRSADDPVVAAQAVADGADYIGCGTVFATTTKKDAGAVIGLAGLRRVVAAVNVPVVGIGGITTARAAEVANTGAAGVAVVGAVMAAPDPSDVVSTMRQAFNAPGTTPRASAGSASGS